MSKSSQEVNAQTSFILIITEMQAKQNTTYKEFEVAYNSHTNKLTGHLTDKNGQEFEFDSIDGLENELAKIQKYLEEDNLKAIKQIKDAAAPNLTNTTKQRLK